MGWGGGGVGGWGGVDGRHILTGIMILVGWAHVYISWGQASFRRADGGWFDQTADGVAYLGIHIGLVAADLMLATNRLRSSKNGKSVSEPSQSSRRHNEGAGLC